MKCTQLNKNQVISPQLWDSQVLFEASSLSQAGSGKKREVTGFSITSTGGEREGPLIWQIRGMTAEPAEKLEDADRDVQKT